MVPGRMRRGFFLPLFPESAGDVVKLITALVWRIPRSGCSLARRGFPRLARTGVRVTTESGLLHPLFLPPLLVVKPPGSCQAILERHPNSRHVPSGAQLMSWMAGGLGESPSTWAQRLLLR